MAALERKAELMKVLALVLVCVLWNVTAQLCLKSGATDSALQEQVWDLSSWVSVLTSPSILAGIILWTISTLLWIYLLSGVDLSYAYALYGLNYVFTPLAAKWYFQESINGLQTAGIAFITLGVGLTVTGKLSS